jgi:hypothetical protein
MSVPRHPWRLIAAAALLAWCGAATYFAWQSTAPPADPSRFGYVPDPQGVARFLDELPEPFFAQAGADCMAKAEERDTFLYRQMNKAHQARYGRPFVVGRQGIGDCVSWGAMHAVYAAEAVDWDTGKIPEPPLLPATESIYGGSRVEARGRDGSGRSAVGGWSDGSTGWGAARWLRD